MLFHKFEWGVRYLFSIKRCRATRLKFVNQIEVNLTICPTRAPPTACRQRLQRWRKASVRREKESRSRNGGGVSVPTIRITVRFLPEFRACARFLFLR